VQERGPRTAATLLRRGKVEEALDPGAASGGAGLAIFDDDLSRPRSESRRRPCPSRWLDRSAASFLDIFASRAALARGRAPRWEARPAAPKPAAAPDAPMGHLIRDRPAGNRPAGRGETQLEIDAGLVPSAASRAWPRTWRAIETGRRGSSAKEGRRAEPRVALAGYTNAGKSTILNS